MLPHASVLNPCLHQGDMAFSWESSLLRISSIYIFTHVGADGKQGSELNVLGRCVCWFPWSWVLAVPLFALVTCGYSAGDSPGAGAALSPATPRDSLPVQRAWSRCEGFLCAPGHVRLALVPLVPCSHQHTHTHTKRISQLEYASWMDMI